VSIKWGSTVYTFCPDFHPHPVSKYVTAHSEFYQAFHSVVGKKVWVCICGEAMNHPFSVGSCPPLLEYGELSTSSRIRGVVHLCHIWGLFPIYGRGGQLPWGHVNVPVDSSSRSSRMRADWTSHLLLPSNAHTPHPWGIQYNTFSMAITCCKAYTALSPSRLCPSGSELYTPYATDCHATSVT